MLARGAEEGAGGLAGLAWVIQVGVQQKLAKTALEDDATADLGST